ncbi:amino acid permease [Nonomuraea monospora]|uniref:Amino acid permease n=1 Tax=Nonomuraea monospora TaxID=568818 RepID=A0ABP5PVS0_9ACTN
MGVIRGTALYVAAIVGPGILTLPALAAAKAGPASLIALAGLLAISVPIAFTFTALHRVVPGPGGIVAYARQAFGERYGLVVGYWFYLGVPIGVPALGLIAGSYTATALGGGKAAEVTVGALITSAALLLNRRRTPGAGQAQLLLTGLLAALILITATVSLPHADTGHLSPFAPHGWLALGPAVLVLVWVLTGWEAVTAFAHGLGDQRAVRRVTAWTLLVVAVLYAAVAVPQILVLGPDATGAPVADLLRIGIGPAAATVAAGLAVVIALNNSAAYIASLAALRSGTPWAAALISAGGLLVAAVTDVGTAEFVALCAASQIPVYVSGLAAGVRLLPRWSASWWCALAATAATATLLVPAGLYLLAPAVIAAAVAVLTRTCINR